MTTDPIRNTLDSLRLQGADAEASLAQQRAELAEAELRLDYIRGAIQNLEALLGEASGAEATARDRARGLNAPSFRVDYTPRRVPSTDWVAEVVVAIGQPASRDQIFDEFERVRGIPDSWNANPRNSFNNALGRAVERGMIQKLDDGRFAPLGYRSAVADDSLDMGGAR